MKLTADLTAASKPTLYTKDWHKAHLAVVTSQVKETPDGKFREITSMDNLGSILGNGGAIMIAVQWKPDDGPNADNPSRVYDNVMVAGKSKKGEELRTDRLCDYINALKVEWDCKKCGQSTSRPFVIENGKYFCPLCGDAASFDFDSDLWLGKRADIQVDVGKGLNDEPRNEVKRVRAIS